MSLQLLPLQLILNNKSSSMVQQLLERECLLLTLPLNCLQLKVSSKMSTLLLVHLLILLPYSNILSTTTLRSMQYQGLVMAMATPPAMALMVLPLQFIDLVLWYGSSWDPTPGGQAKSSTPPLIKSVSNTTKEKMYL